MRGQQRFVFLEKIRRTKMLCKHIFVRLILAVDYGKKQCAVMAVEDKNYNAVGSVGILRSDWFLQATKQSGVA